jgi:hypothetical protein
LVGVAGQAPFVNYGLYAFVFAINIGFGGSNYIFYFSAKADNAHYKSLWWNWK